MFKDALQFGNGDQWQLAQISILKVTWLFDAPE